MNTKDRFIASLLGGAIGDALGYPIEFLRLSQIIDRFGDKGLTDLLIDSKTNKAIISDDTQMTLFTVDGMIWAYLRCSERGIGSYAGSGTYQSYLRWYYTQTGIIGNELWLQRQPHEQDMDISILDVKELFIRRAPGNTCLSALGGGQMGTTERPINNSKGCGGVMRVAPVGLFLHQEPEYTFRIGCDIAAITHGHPTGYLAAGTYATIIAELVNGKSILDSIGTEIQVLKSYPKNDETLNAILNAVELSNAETPPVEAISEIGEGWVAEEALAIALYCALKEKDFKKALLMSVNQDGDSDSTGSICGSIMGACYGMEPIPKQWVQDIELGNYIKQMAIRLHSVCISAFGR